MRHFAIFLAAVLSTAASAQSAAPQLTAVVTKNPVPVYSEPDFGDAEQKIDPKALKFPIRVFEEDSATNRLKVRINERMVWVERRHFKLDKPVDARCVSIGVAQMTAADRGANPACTH